jgi:hypothetical protein
VATKAAFRLTPAVVALFALLLWRRKKMQSEPPTKPGVIRSNVSAEDRATVITAISAQGGWPPREVDKCIMIESGWRTDARNPISNASGLIQLMPAWFKRHRFREDLATGSERAAEFRKLGALEQLPWLLTYFREVGKHWHVPGDTYLAFAAPAFVGADNETIVYQVNSKAWQQNPAWRDTPNGPITAGSIRRLLLRKLGGVNV